MCVTCYLEVSSPLRPLTCNDTPQVAIRCFLGAFIGRLLGPHIDIFKPCVSWSSSRSLPLDSSFYCHCQNIILPFNPSRNRWQGRRSSPVQGGRCSVSPPCTGQVRASQPWSPLLGARVGNDVQLLHFCCTWFSLAYHYDLIV